MINGFKMSLAGLILIGSTSIAICQKNFVRVDQVQGVPMTISYNINSHHDVEGSKYLFDDWKEIRIERRSEVNLLIPQGRFDLYDNLILINGKAGLLQLDKPEEVSLFFIGGKEFELSTYGTGQFGFFEVIFSGKSVVLYKKHNCWIQKGKAFNGITKGTPDKYVKGYDYYVKRSKENGDALKLKVAKRKVFLRSTLYPELAAFLNNSRGVIETETDVKRIFEFFDQSTK